MIYWIYIYIAIFDSLFQPVQSACHTLSHIKLFSLPTIFVVHSINSLNLLLATNCDNESESELTNMYANTKCKKKQPHTI